MYVYVCIYTRKFWGIERMREDFFSLFWPRLNIRRRIIILFFLLFSFWSKRTHIALYPKKARVCSLSLFSSLSLWVYSAMWSSIITLHWRKKGGKEKEREREKEDGGDTREKKQQQARARFSYAHTIENTHYSNLDDVGKNFFLF